MLTQEKLQQIIDQFDEHALRQQGIFGIYQYGGGPDESFIRANKEGLELYALELLKSAKRMEGIPVNKGVNSIPFDEDWTEESSDMHLHYIEPVTRKQKIKSDEEHKRFISKLLPYGCGLIFIILLIAIIVGFETMFKWLF
jgi:hypothetical protein